MKYSKSKTKICTKKIDCGILVGHSEESFQLLYLLRWLYTVIVSWISNTTFSYFWIFCIVPMTSYQNIFSSTQFHITYNGSGFKASLTFLVFTLCWIKHNVTLLCSCWKVLMFFLCFYCCWPWSIWPFVKIFLTRTSHIFIHK